MTEMSQLIEVESVQRLDIKPGETLIIKLGRGDLSEKEATDISERITSRLPEGVNLLVVNRDVDFYVVGAAQ